MLLPHTSMPIQTSTLSPQEALDWPRLAVQTFSTYFLVLISDSRDGKMTEEFSAEKRGFLEGGDYGTRLQGDRR